MHRRPARAEGNLDQHASSLLPARANDLLGAAQVRRLKSVALSHPKRGDACRIGGTALARASTARRSWRLARRGSVGVAPRDGAVSRLGDRAEKYAVLLVLSPVDLLLLKLGEAIADNTDETSRGQFDVRSAATARINGFDRLVVPAGKSGARCIFCGCILRDFIVSGARFF